jgi:hypothetical protein
MRFVRWQRSVCVFTIAALCGTGWAAELYRWVDEQGRVQMSDRPPPKASGPVTRHDTPKDDVAPEQRKAAQERAARDQERLKKAADERGRAAAPQALRPSSAASSGFADESDPSLPTRASAEDCRMWRQEYRRNEACFAPYRTARGGIKPEAFAACGRELVDPEFECGGKR